MMQNKNIYIIVGSIATGKSTVSKILREKNLKVIDSDEVTHRLYEKKEIQRVLIDKFSENIISENKVNRDYLRDIVFSDEKKKIELENTIHPLIMEEIFYQVENSKEKNIFIELPLYYKVENIVKKNVQNYKIILITILEDTQVKRLIKRNNISKEKALNLVYNIKNILDFEKKVDYIIKNENSIKNLNKQIDNILKMERLDEDS